MKLAAVVAALWIVHCCGYAGAGQIYRLKRLPPPSQNRPEPPTTTATATSTTQSSADFVSNSTLPSEVLENQCTSGTNYSLAVGTLALAEPGELYVDLGQPAQCNGSIDRWDVCLSATGNSLNRSIHFVVIRDVRGSYVIESVNEVSFPADLSSQCYSKEAQSEVFVKQGDLFGFISGESSQVLLAGGENSTLRVIGYSRSNGRFPDVGVSLQFEGVVTESVALFRVIINSSNSSTTDRTACDCSEDQTPDITSSIIFISIVSGAGAIILLQSLIILFLSYCLCRQKSRCWCCVGKPKVTHTIRIEPLDQSMQYNDLYVPSDQKKGVVLKQPKNYPWIHPRPYSCTAVSKRRSFNNVQFNPAYNSQTNVADLGSKSQDLDVPTAVAKSDSQRQLIKEGYLYENVEAPDDLEHTYEMIKSLKLAT